MQFEVKILKRAEQEVEEAFLYYESKSIDLGEKFLIEYEDQLDTLSNIPFFAVKYDVIRKLPMKKFPCSIHFRVDEDKQKVFIESVSCDYQDPKTTKIKT